jgi:hypothetical protein
VTVTTKKVTKKKVTKKVEEISSTKTLSVDELVKMEVAGALGQNRKLELKCYRIELEKAKKELTLLSANYTLKTKEINEIQHKLLELEARNQAKIDGHKLFVNELRERLELDEKWGYNPETGEIKE